jgi:hypothetical protein
MSNKMQRYTVYLYLETALHVSGGTSTHHQERIQLYLQHLLFVTPLLLSAAVVEELEPYHLRVPIVLKCGSLELLETSGPLQACNGIALPLHFKKCGA